MKKFAIVVELLKIPASDREWKKQALNIFYDMHFSQWICLYASSLERALTAIFVSGYMLVKEMRFNHALSTDALELYKSRKHVLDVNFLQLVHIENIEEKQIATITEHFNQSQKALLEGRRATTPEYLQNNGVPPVNTDDSFHNNNNNNNSNNAIETTGIARINMELSVGNTNASFNTQPIDNNRNTFQRRNDNGMDNNTNNTTNNNTNNNIKGWGNGNNKIVTSERMNNNNNNINNYNNHTSGWGNQNRQNDGSNRSNNFNINYNNDRNQNNRRPPPPSPNKFMAKYGSRDANGGSSSDRNYRSNHNDNRGKRFNYERSQQQQPRGSFSNRGGAGGRFSNRGGAWRDRSNNNIEAIDCTERLIDYADVKEGSVYVGIAVASRKNNSFVNIGMRDTGYGENTFRTKDGMLIGHNLSQGTKVHVRVIKKFKGLLNEQFENAKDYKPKIEWFEGTWSRYKPERGKDKRGVTGSDIKKLQEISNKINTIPSEINIHKTIFKILELRKQSIIKKKGIDWSTAESLAFGTLLEEGFPVRLVGQDSGRGTFSQRHSVLRNQTDNSRYIPLNNISKNQKKFEAVDSLLSELAVLGFEYGYSLVEPSTLTIWEAQFGDFANGAQVIIDQFIASGERKWSRASGLVLLLPHGYEGQGPEHSSGRLERFLQLCAKENLQVMNCTTPANYFHALRRQMHRDFRKPLVIMTPKSLLRNKYCVSHLNDFSKENSFHRVLWDHAIDPKLKGFIKLQKSSKIRKVILCSGKVYFDLLEAREKLKVDDVILYRIEQLYSFPAKALVKELKPYAKSATFHWCQEEPKNMGAWFSVRDYIQWTLDNIRANNNKISYIGRNPDASPATGYAKRHISQQQEIIKKVFE